MDISFSWKRSPISHVYSSHDIKKLALCIVHPWVFVSGEPYGDKHTVRDSGSLPRQTAVPHTLGTWMATFGNFGLVDLWKEKIHCSTFQPAAYLWHVGNAYNQRWKQQRNYCYKHLTQHESCKIFVAYLPNTGGQLKTEQHVKDFGMYSHGCSTHNSTWPWDANNYGKLLIPVRAARQSCVFLIFSSRSLDLTGPVARFYLHTRNTFSEGGKAVRLGCWAPNSPQQEYGHNLSLWNNPCQVAWLATTSISDKYRSWWPTSYRTWHLFPGKDWTTATQDVADRRWEPWKFRKKNQLNSQTHLCTKKTARRCIRLEIQFQKPHNPSTTLNMFFLFRHVFFMRNPGMAQGWSRHSRQC